MSAARRRAPCERGWRPVPSRAAVTSACSAPPARLISLKQREGLLSLPRYLPFSLSRAAEGAG